MPIQITAPQDIDTALAARYGGAILDIATGSGWVIDWLLRTMRDPSHAVGIDLRALDAAALDDDSVFNRQNVDYMQMDAADLDFDDASFDTVAIANSLHHMADAQAVLTEMRRVLKPGGTLLVVEMYRDQQDGPQMTHILMHHWWANIDAALGIVHNETFTRQELIDIVNGLGLEKLTVMDASFGAGGDPHDTERRDILLKRIDHYVQRASELPDYAAYEARANELRLRLLKHGFITANSLIAIGEK